MSSNRLTSFFKAAWYHFLRIPVWMAATLFLRARATGQSNIPKSGGVLIVANHQSHLDPPMIGTFSMRRMNYLARESLFKFAPFRWLINSLNAIPIDREGLGLNGIKETLKRLKAEQMVLIFPEGTRSRDGQMSALKPGFLALARRTNSVIMPVGLAGMYEAWPRQNKLPSLGTVNIHYGPVITQEQIQALDDEQLMAEVDRTMHACFEIAKQARVARVKK
jgi:1-acyl-sn-glycerol-3-phosphate acyltransferase